MTRLAFACIPLLGCLCLCPGAARAEEDEEVKVTVVAILASQKETPNVHHKLQHVAKEIQKKQPNLNTFILGHTTRLTMTIGKKENFPLVEGQVAEVTVLEKSAKDGAIKLMVKAPKVGEITYKCCCDKFFPIMTNYQTKKQEWLVVAVMVPPCP